MKAREVITYKEYFDEFFNAQPQKVRDKIIKILDIIEQVERTPMTYLIMNEYYEEKRKETNK